MSILRIGLVCVAAMAGMATAGRADIIAQYNFDPALPGGFGNPAPTFVGPGFSASNVGITGFTSIAAVTTYPTVPILTLDNVFVNLTTSETAALGSGRFLSFTFDKTDPNAVSYNIDNISFTAGRGGPSTPRSFYLYSSVDGFTVGNAIAVEEIPTVRSVFTPYSFALGPQFDNLTGPVEFRLFATVPAAGNQLDFDSFLFEGQLNQLTLAPEPGSLALCGLAGLVGGVVLWRRRRKAG